MTNDEIRAIALAKGFKLKPQPDGTEDLNPYVYDTIRACIAADRQASAEPVGYVAAHEVDVIRIGCAVAIIPPMVAAAKQIRSGFIVPLFTRPQAAPEWLDIESAPADTDILLYDSYGPDGEPEYFVGRFAWVERQESRFVSSKDNRRTFEDVTIRERDWGDTPNYCASHWMPLPAAPQPEQKP